MKITFNISCIALLTTAYIVPAHAMWTRLSLAALRSNTVLNCRQLATFADNRPTSLQDLSTTRPTLLATPLATQHAEQTYEQESEQSNDEQNNQRGRVLGLGLLGGAALAAYENDDRFEPKIAHADTGKNIALGLGAAALTAGGIYWWYKRPTCKTPEDLEDKQMLKRSLEYFGRGDFFYQTKLIKLIENHASTATIETCISCIIENFAAYCKNEANFRLINKLIDLKPESLPAFAQAVSENMSLILISEYGYLFVRSLLHKHPEGIHCFAQAAVEQSDALLTQPFAVKIIEQLIKKVPSFKDSFSQKNPACTEFCERLDIASEIITMLLNSPATQTAQHFKTNKKFAKEIIKQFLPKIPEDCLKFKALIEKIISVEYDEQLAGNYTFLHGCPWALHFYHDIDAHLRSFVLDLPPAPLSLRFFKKPNHEKSNEYRLARENLLKNGTPWEYRNNIDSVQKKVIFMNAALFANRPGSNTFTYLTKNHGQNAPQRGILEKIFIRINLEKYLNKYSRELNELEVLHNKANQFGAGIMFSFSPKMLNQSVYMCKPFGRKAWREFHTGRGTDSAQVMLDTLRITPEIIHQWDPTEYIFVVTKDCGLNPYIQESGDLKIIPVNTADPELYAIYEQKRDELMVKIKADIDAERAAWSEEEKIAHETSREQMENFFKQYNCLNDCEQSRVKEA